MNIHNFTPTDRIPKFILSPLWSGLYRLEKLTGKAEQLGRVLAEYKTVSESIIDLNDAVRMINLMKQQPLHLNEHGVVINDK